MKTVHIGCGAKEPEVMHTLSTIRSYAVHNV
jgi:hypothetical protein